MNAFQALFISLGSVVGVFSGSIGVDIVMEEQAVSTLQQAVVTSTVTFSYVNTQGFKDSSFVLVLFLCLSRKKS